LSRRRRGAGTLCRGGDRRTRRSTAPGREGAARPGGRAVTCERRTPFLSGDAAGEARGGRRSQVVTTILQEIEEVRRAVASARGLQLSVGLVPTMGALHEGHVSLIRAARQECGQVIVWLFVNPAQFGPQEDLTRYPRPFETDHVLCQREGVDLLFS